MTGVNTRAQQYEDSGAFGDLPMDGLRAYAFTDLLKGTPAEERIACAEAQDEAADIAEALAWANARAARNAAQARAGDSGGLDSDDESGDDGDVGDDDGFGGDEPEGDGPRPRGPGKSRASACSIPPSPAA